MSRCKWLIPAVPAVLALAQAASAAPPDRAELARGEYLVTRVGMCADCHTPRDEKGALRRDAWLTGAPIGLRPVAPIPFATYAPDIAGIPPHYTETQLVTFLETGERPDGSTAAPPMPEYRLTPADARAVAAYLGSLRR